MFNLRKNIDLIFFSLITCLLIALFLNCKAHECKQHTSDLQCLLKEASDTQKRLISFLNDLKSKYKDATVMDPGTKQMPTIEQLLKTRWNGDASMITDYARATIGVQDIHEVYMCLDDITALPLTIVSIKDHFGEPNEEMYRDINIVIKDNENNHLGEVQINTKNILEYKNSFGHKLFEEMRNIKANACCEKRDLTQEETNIIKQLSALHGIGYNDAFSKSLRIYDMKIRLGVYGILIKNNQVLMVKTQSGSKSIYNFPGGGVEENEGFFAALKRECTEEIKKDITIEKLIYHSKNLYIHEDFASTYMFNLYYKISLIDNDYEIKNGKWFKLSNLPFEKMLPIDKEFADFLIKN